MNTLTTLPAPASGDTRHSIVTLAHLLLVTPAEIDALLVDGDDDERSPDIHSDRLFGGYVGARGEFYGDCWLTHEAAERIADQLPEGLLARRVAAGGIAAAADLTPGQVLDIVTRYVAQGGAA
jgi:hypothetical protein